jgi:hypothetical protein
MPAILESQNLGDLLKFEAPQLYSRDTVTVAAGSNLRLGAVVAYTPTGTIKALTPAASDSSKVAVGVLIVDAEATLAERDALMVSRHAIVSDRALHWPAAITPEQKATAVAQLRGLGVLVRTGV